jgi:hypothetical protein
MRFHDAAGLACHFRTSAWIGGLALWLLGCGSPTQDVHGRAVWTRVSEDGTGPTETASWSGRTIEALSPTASGYQRFSADTDARGEFSIPAVPGGPFWLALPDELTAIPGEGKLFAWTEARELDLSYTDIGLRPGESRRLPIAVTNLSPAQAEDWMEAYSTANSWKLSWGLLTPLGSTETTWPRESPFTLRGHPSEQLVVKQWRKTIQDKVTVEATVRAGSIPSPDETATMLTIPLADAGPRTASVQVDEAAFTAELTPLPQPASGWWSFEIVATALPKEPLAPRRSLLRASAQFPARDADLSGLAYNDPYPASYSRLYTLSYIGGRDYPVPGDTALRASCGTGFRLVGDAGALTRDVLRPRLSLPQALEIDGQSAMQENAQVSSSPTIRWQSPRLGAVSFYMLRLVRIAKLPDRSTPENTVGNFLTTETELKIPEGVLKTGEQYFLELIAFSGSDIDATTAPRRAALLERKVDTAHLCSAGIHLAP